MTPTRAPSRLGEVATLLVDRVRSHYGPGPRADELAAALSVFAGDRQAVNRQSLALVETTAQTVFRHLELTLADNLQPQVHTPGWPEPDPIAIRRAGAQITAVQRDADGTATICLMGLADAAVAAPLLAGAFTLVRGASTLVLDLRGNVGGDPATVAVIVDWFGRRTSPAPVRCRVPLSHAPVVDCRQPDRGAARRARPGPDRAADGKLG